MGYDAIAVENATSGRGYIEVRSPERGVVEIYTEDDGEEGHTVVMTLDEVCALMAHLNEAMRAAL